MRGLSIIHAAAMTGVGRSLEETRASLETGVCRYRRSPFVGLRGARHLIAPVLHPSLRVPGVERGLLLATPSLERCLATLREAKVALFLSQDDPPGKVPPQLEPVAERARASLREWEGLDARIAEWLVARQIRVTHVETIRSGVSSGVELFERASRILEQGSVDRALVGAVSSACEPAIVEWNEWRALLENPHESVQTVGGEGAAFLVLSSSGGTARVRGWGGAKETVSNNSAPTRADALTRVVEQVLSAGESTGGITDIFVDLPDSARLAREWSLASTRTIGARGSTPKLWRPVASFGQMGAVTIPLYAGLACHGRTGRKLGLAVSCSDTSYRGAVVVEHL
jgi:hypothetical protein